MFFKEAFLKFSKPSPLDIFRKFVFDDVLCRKILRQKIIKKQTFNQVVFTSIIHISTRHEQMCLMRLHFERYLPYHQYMVGDDGRGTSRNVASLNTFLLDMIDCEHSKRSLIKRIVSWHGKRWALNRQTKVILSIHVSV